jgi:hypothetical protein
MASDPFLSWANRTVLRAAREEPYLSIQDVVVFVRDLDASKRFYVQQLGFELLTERRLPTVERWIEVAPPDGSADLALVEPKRDSPDYKLIGGYRWVLFMTEDVHAPCDPGVPQSEIKRLLDEQFGPGRYQLCGMATARSEATEEYHRTQLSQKPNDANTHSIMVRFSKKNRETPMGPSVSTGKRWISIPRTSTHLAISRILRGKEETGIRRQHFIVMRSKSIPGTKTSQITSRDSYMAKLMVGMRH